MVGSKKRVGPSTIVVGLLVALWFFVCLIPFFFLIMCTLKDQKELMKNGVFAIPETLNLDNYIEVFSGNIWHYFLNSVIVMVVSLIILLMFSAFDSSTSVIVVRDGKSIGLIPFSINSLASSSK